MSESTQSTQSATQFATQSADELEQLRSAVAALERRCSELERRLRFVEGYQER